MQSFVRWASRALQHLRLRPSSVRLKLTSFHENGLLKYPKVDAVDENRHFRLLGHCDQLDLFYRRTWDHTFSSVLVADKTFKVHLDLLGWENVGRKARGEALPWRRV